MVGITLVLVLVLAYDAPTYATIRISAHTNSIYGWYLGETQKFTVSCRETCRNILDAAWLVPDKLSLAENTPCTKYASHSSLALRPPAQYLAIIPISGALRMTPLIQKVCLGL